MLMLNHSVTFLICILLLLKYIKHNCSNEERKEKTYKLNHIFNERIRKKGILSWIKYFLWAYTRTLYQIQNSIGWSSHTEVVFNCSAKFMKRKKNMLILLMCSVHELWKIKYFTFFASSFKSGNRLKVSLKLVSQTFLWSYFSNQ